MASLKQMSINISAGKRLFRDLKDFNKNKDDFPFCNVIQQEDDQYRFHVNFFHPVMEVIHFILEFNNDYPNKPPMILLCGKLKHDNIFYNTIYGRTRDGYPYICLDLLKEREVYRNRYGFESTYSGGWSSAYTLGSILMQFYSFLFDKNVEQSGGYVNQNNNLTNCVGDYHKSVINFTCSCGHTMKNPFPQCISVKKSYNDDFPPLNEKIVEKKLSNLVLNEKSSNITLFEDEYLTQYFLQFIPISYYKNLKEVSTFWRSTLNNIYSLNSILCYHSKLTLKETIIGIGIQVEFHRDGNLRSISSEFDYLSYDSFNSGVRNSTWNKPFNYFLPLVIKESNFDKGYPILIDTLRKIFNVQVIRSSEVLDFFSTFMNCIVVELFKVGNNGEINRHASEKALTGYTSIHHLLLMLLNKFPEMVEITNTKITNFINDERKRYKDEIPDLGKFLVYLVIHPKYRWKDIWASYIKETFIRNVRWMIDRRNGNPHLAIKWLPPNERLNLTLKNDSCKTSRSLIMFQVYFLEKVACPDGIIKKDIMKKYNLSGGKPEEKDLMELQYYCNDISNIWQWRQFFTMINVPVPQNDVLYRILEESVIKSADRGYHGVSSGRGRGRGRNHY